MLDPGAGSLLDRPDGQAAAAAEAAAAAGVLVATALPQGGERAAAAGAGAGAGAGSSSPPNDLRELSGVFGGGGGVFFYGCLMTRGCLSCRSDFFSRRRGTTRLPGTPARYCYSWVFLPGSGAGYSGEIRFFRVCSWPGSVVRDLRVDTVFPRFRGLARLTAIRDDGMALRVVSA